MEVTILALAWRDWGKHEKPQVSWSLGQDLDSYLPDVKQGCYNSFVVLTLLQIEESGLDAVNVREVLLEMRRFRMGLIQTPDQLRFSYWAIIEGSNKYLNGTSVVSKIVILQSFFIFIPNFTCCYGSLVISNKWEVKYRLHVVTMFFYSLQKYDLNASC
jgi:hypothetical protein